MVQGRHSQSTQAQKSTVDEYTGQWIGLSVQFTRLQIGALHEFMKLIQEERAVVEGREIANLIASIPKASRDDWKALVATALGKRGDHNPLTKALLRIRNALAFHYYQPKGLVGGFKSSSSSTPRGLATKQRSIRRTVDDGDAFLLRRRRGKCCDNRPGSGCRNERHFKDATEVGNKLHPALGAMLERFLSERQRGMT